MQLSQKNIDDIIEVVRLAGSKEILPVFRNLLPEQISKKSKQNPRDLVTIADHAAEKFIQTEISKILPKANLVGEESVAENPKLLDLIGTSDVCVIIDPIDGTGNFATGLAVFGTMVAVVIRNETIFGLLYDPIVDDWIFSKHGEGSWFVNSNGRPSSIQTRAYRPHYNARGFLALDDYSANDRSTLYNGFASIAQIHDIRCSCHEYRQIASGEADFLRSFSLKPWDHAAGQLVLKEAGGWAAVDGLMNYKPSLYSGRMIAASCRDLGEEITQISSTLP
ncbi:MAG: inositol monophosphatase family protein [bacterium]